MKKLILLSDVLDSLVCPASHNKSVDSLFSVGLTFVGTPPRCNNAAELADLQRQAYALNVVKAFRRPRLPGAMGADEYQLFGTEKVLVNDLWVPGYSTDEDGFMHIYFPVPTTMPLSSSFLAKDWRFVALAWIAVVDSKTAPTKMVFTALDGAGRRVMAVVELSALDAFKAMAKVKLRDQEVPGPVCARCAKAEVCETLQMVLDPHLAGLSETLPKDKAMMTQALFFQRMDLETRLEIIEEKRRKIDIILNRLCVDGLLKVGGESFQIPNRKVRHLDYAKAHRVLQVAGCWRDSFATIRLGELMAAAEDFPADVRKQLEDATIETTTEPSISEAVKHGRTVKPTLLRGVS